MVIKDCGPADSDNLHEQENGLFHKTAVTIIGCNSVHLKNVTVKNDSTNRGLLIINSKDNSVLNAVTHSGIALVYNSTTAFGSHLGIQGYSPVGTTMALDCCFTIIIQVQNYSVGVML